jgi:hypothetical protein
MKQFVLAFIPLCIGLSAIGVLRKWFLIMPADPKASEEFRIKNRKTLLGCSILSTAAGILGMLIVLGLIDFNQPMP